jgi:hypothetical protein
MPSLPTMPGGEPAPVLDRDNIIENQIELEEGKMEKPKRSEAQIDLDIRHIMFNKEALVHKAYFDKNHLLHDEAVEVMEKLAQEKLGNEPYAPEIMPVHIDADSLKLKGGE